MKKLLERFNSNSEELKKSEVLEIILRLGGSGENSRETSESLIKNMGGLVGVFNASFEQLVDAGGVDHKQAWLIKAIRRISLLILEEKVIGRDAIRCKKDIMNYLKFSLAGDRSEKFLAIYLNARNEVLTIETLHEGTVNRTTVYPRKAIERAFLHNAKSVVFVHNHPSGNSSPSKADKFLIKMLDRAALAVDLIIHDHLIIGAATHFSAREHGWIIGYSPVFSNAAE